MKQNHIDKISDEKLLNLYNKHRHLSKMAAELNVPQVTIWRRAKMLGLEFKGNSVGVKTPTEEILQGLHPHFQTYKLKNKMLKEGIMKNECSVCGISMWQGKSLNMQLDHINGNSTDHRLENLRMICPNCHSQTDTFCGKNK
jgi:5-methylcytosine-specific restriction endonuclease McrA